VSYPHYSSECNEVRRASGFPEVVCLCGSTRFKDEFVRQNLLLSMQGKIVLTIGCDMRTDEELANEYGYTFTEAKPRLDELHKRKIDLADRVLVLNVDGYIGDSTRSEIAYAKAHRVPVDYLVSDHSESIA
jgi:hypothetical protein